MIDETKPFDRFEYLDLKDLKVMLRYTVMAGNKEDAQFILDLSNEIHRREQSLQTIKDK